MRTVTYTITNGTITCKTTSYAEMLAFKEKHPNIEVKTEFVELDRYFDVEPNPRIDEIEKKRKAMWKCNQR